MKLSPARLEPLFVPRIWGSGSLAPLFPEPPESAEPIGEVWLTGNDCCFAGGFFAGRTLAEAWREMPPEWAGTRSRTFAQFPILVKFIFPKDKLSVQVHPGDAYAQQHEKGGMGKTEMWYVVSARAGAEVRVGLKSGVTPDSFRRATVQGSVEDCLEQIGIEAGDAIFIPAGTAHTIGPGSVLCEIQEYSDVTYRVYDYNRLTAEGKPRPLHIPQAMEVIQFGEQSCGKLEPVRLERGPVRESYLIACRYFEVERWEFAEQVGGVTRPEHFELAIFLSGQGQWEWTGGAERYAPGQVWLLPAGLGAYRLLPESSTALLRAAPGDVNEFVRRMADQGVPEEAWSRLVYP